MGFVQFYFGLPMAMVILSARSCRVYYRLKVYTAYEYLEKRFDLQDAPARRALLFLLAARPRRRHRASTRRRSCSRTVLGWPLQLTNLAHRRLVIVYTVVGRHARGQPDAEAADGGDARRHGGGVRHRRLAGCPRRSRFGDARRARRARSGKHEGGRLLAAACDTRYTFWSGLTGGLLPGARRTSAPTSRRCSAISSARSAGREPAGPAVQRPAQGPDAVPHPVRRRDGVRLLPVHPAAAALQPRRSWRGCRPARPAEVASLEATHARLFAEKRRAHRRVAGAARPRRRRAARRRGAHAGAAGRKPARWWPGPGPGRTPRTRTTSSSASCSTTSRAGSSGCWWRSSSPPRCPPTPRALSRWAPRRGRLLPTSPSGCAERPAHCAAARRATAAWGVVAVGFADVRLAAGQPHPGGEHPGLAVLRPDARRVPGGFLPRSRGGRAAFWATVAGEIAVLAAAVFGELGFLWYNVLGCAVVVGLAPLLQRVWSRPSPV